MIPCAFDESNIVFDKPDSMTRDECVPINAFMGTCDIGPVIITCWKLTKEELDEINRTGRVWCFHYGPQLQPHALEVKSPFQ